MFISRQPSTEKLSGQILATQDEVTAEVRIGSTPDITSNQALDIIPQSQCELISTLIYIYSYYTG